MMTAKEIRSKFLAYFESKGHKIASSAPIVLKDDPTLMFTNAGMNQFKDYFLGNRQPDNPRIANTQKCLRVSGKHNDLEEVGVDTYHHTMFEMLGNWSIGDYFKKEAIQYSWELLTEVYKLDKKRLYVTVFEGDTKENLPPSSIALAEWKKYVSEEHIVFGNKKDNFWEMGDTGPCGPCSEIHIDLRPQSEIDAVPGHLLVNKDHPQVIEIWNNVFIQYNRKADGSLEQLPEKHVDTGMGLERLVRAIQNKTSNYDTDLFTGTIHLVEKISEKQYQFSDSKIDISFRVISDHIRAVAFTIADGQLPSNTGAGYVIRRILRRAVRYYYSYLDYKEPLLYQLIDHLAVQFEDVFPELAAQSHFVSRVIREEERSFLRTLEGGLRRIEDLSVTDNKLEGRVVFELYDTYGFPVDLTRLIAQEKGWQIDEVGFEVALLEQKERSRADAKKETGDWQIVHEGQNSHFIGYDALVLEEAKVLKYRIVKQKEASIIQMVLDKTTFYPEGGGQVGDTGILFFDGEVIQVIDTIKENDLIIHIIDHIPDRINAIVYGEVDGKRRSLIQNNHTATHLLHAALRQVLGSHVQQKGSLVKEDQLRFDVSHFQKITDQELLKIEQIVNAKIRENIPLKEARQMPIEEAKMAGAMMLFGEKYGETVRMITFDDAYSKELCGGCHVQNTGEIGYFKILSESAIAAGVRRLEAITSVRSEQFIYAELQELKAVRTFFKNQSSAAKNVADLLETNKDLQKEIERLRTKQAEGLKNSLQNAVEYVNGTKWIGEILEDVDAKSAKNLTVQLHQLIGSSVICFGFVDAGKAYVSIGISPDLVQDKGLHAGQLVKEIAPIIQGGGGGQPTYASAGGTNAEGLRKAIENIKGKLI